MEKEKTLVRDLTTGNIPELLLRFALPLFVSNALQAIYNIVDMVVVGRCIGGAGMAAVSTGGDVLHMLTFIAMGFSSAGQVIIARDVGAKRMDRVKKTIGTLFSVLMSAAFVMMVLCLAFRIRVLNWLNTPAEAYDYTMDYTVVCCLGLMFIYGYNVVSAILRGMGDSKRPFSFIAIAAILNIVLDVLFVGFMGMEVFGAALATVIGQGASFIFSIVYLYRRKESFGFDFKPSSFVPDRHTLSRLVALGIPMSIQSASISFSKIVLAAWINAEGVVYSAMAGIYNKIGVMCGVVSQAFTAAGSSMVGQNLGAAKYERVPKILTVVGIIGVALSTFAMAVILPFSGLVFSLFTKDAAVLAEASILLLPIIVNLYGSAARSVAFSLINGSGHTGLNLTIALLDGLVCRIGLAFLLARSMGCQGFWMGDALAGWMPLIIASVFFLSGNWRHARK